jgi:hypothetical protein
MPHGFKLLEFDEERIATDAIGCVKIPIPALSCSVSKYVQCNYDYLRKLPFVIILYSDNFRQYRLHNPIESILEGRTRTGSQKLIEQQKYVRFSLSSMTEWPILLMIL